MKTKQNKKRIVKTQKIIITERNRFPDTNIL